LSSTRRSEDSIGEAGARFFPEEQVVQALWFWLTSFMVAMYGTLDGFDFGAGILHPFVAKSDRERRQVLAAIGPFWDGNEVWLLAGGGALFVAFPKVLASGFSGLYMAMFLVVWTLILRGIAIEFRSHVTLDLWRAFWDSVFFIASCLMPIFLGAALGNVVRGVPIDQDGQFNLPLFTNFRPYQPVGILDWYSVLVGIFVFVTITAHGALFLAWKTDGEVQARCRRLALPLWGTAAAFGIVTTFATAHVNPDIYANLLKAPLAWLGLSLFLAGIVSVFVAHRKGIDWAAFVASGVFIVGILVATAASVFPVMLRSTLNQAWNLTAYNASVSPAGLRAGAAWWFIGFPLVAVYFTIVFRLHRGKASAARDGEGY
jgi:cytochrome bd ubiquinol oxidase subunit II